MQTFVYKIKDELGLHARPAGLLVKSATACTSEVTLQVNGKSANAKRLFAVMGLGAKQGDTLEFSVEGTSEAEDSAKLKEFCEQNF